MSNQEQIAVIVWDDATFGGQLLDVGKRMTQVSWRVAEEVRRQGHRLPKLNLANGGVASGVLVLFFVPVAEGNARYRFHAGCVRLRRQWRRQ